jgi:rhombotail lipoprotein
MRRLIASLLVLFALGACSYNRSVQRRSNLMSYLYPQRMEPPPPSPNVRLQLPLRIGIAFAFVPPEPVHGRYGADFRTVFPPDAETRLLSIVKKAFEGRDWVSEIAMIPSSYLEPHGGFENLDQVAQLMNVDVIALASLDQLQVSHPRRASFLYVSVIGAYLLPLDRNETRTLIDAAVFHVPSRTFLLRAPGISRISGSSTAMDIEAKLDERSIKGFDLAMQDLARNLNREVDTFKASVASGERKDVDIVTAKGASVRGGGAFAWWDVLLAVIALWTCHLMHWNWQHALLNAIAALPPLFAMRRRLWQLARFALFAAPLIALAVRAGFDGEYRGASGLIVAMWVYAAMVTRAGPMLVVIAAKLAGEALGLMPAHEGFVTVALAHYAGATVGLVLGHFEALFDSSMPDTLIESPARSPDTVTSWPTFFSASSWLSSL